MREKEDMQQTENYPMALRGGQDTDFRASICHARQSDERQTWLSVQPFARVMIMPVYVCNVTCYTQPGELKIFTYNINLS